MISCDDDRPTGAKIITSYFAAKVALRRHRLRADVRERNPSLIERQPPPSLCLRPQPRMHKRNARRGRSMRRHRRSRSQPRRIERQLPQRQPQSSASSTCVHQQRSRGKMLPIRIERLLRRLDMRLLQRINQRQQRSLPRIRNRVDQIQRRQPSPKPDRNQPPAPSPPSESTHPSPEQPSH